MTARLEKYQNVWVYDGDPLAPWGVARFAGVLTSHTYVVKHIGGQESSVHIRNVCITYHEAALLSTLLDMRSLL